MYQLIESNGKEMKEVLNDNRVVWKAAKEVCVKKKFKALWISTGINFLGLGSESFNYVKIGGEVFHFHEMGTNNNWGGFLDEERVPRAAKKLGLKDDLTLQEIEVLLCF